MVEINREQIIKALEIHTGILDMPCEECPYNCDAHDEICLDVLTKDALALINSQEQRINELTEENERLTRLANLRQRDLDNANDLLFKVEDENERLKAQKYYIHSDDRIEMIPTVESVRADTVRTMQERLKADAVTIQDHTGKLGVVVGVGNIDDVAREMLEGEK